MDLLPAFILFTGLGITAMFSIAGGPMAQLRGAQRWSEQHAWVDDALHAFCLVVSLLLISFAGLLLAATMQAPTGLPSKAPALLFICACLAGAFPVLHGALADKDGLRSAICRIAGIRERNFMTRPRHLQVYGLLIAAIGAAAALLA